MSRARATHGPEVRATHRLDCDRALVRAALSGPGGPGIITQRSSNMNAWFAPSRAFFLAAGAGAVGQNSSIRAVAQASSLCRTGWKPVPHGRFPTALRWGNDNLATDSERPSVSRRALSPRLHPQCHGPEQAGIQFFRAGRGHVPYFLAGSACSTTRTSTASLTGTSSRPSWARSAVLTSATSQDSTVNSKS